MKRTVAAALLLVVQLALVLSVAGKYLYERRTRPRVWVRTTQFDPSLPLRGRYLALQFAIDACRLPHDVAYYTQGYQDANGKSGRGIYRWNVSLGVQGGHLSPVLADTVRSSEGLQYLMQTDNQGCGSVPLSPSTEFFIPDTAKSPFPLPKGEELWVEVTAPESGPPRPIQLARSNSTGFHLIHFE